MEYAPYPTSWNTLPRLAGTPTLICWGMKDFVFSPEFLEEWERHLPHAEVHRALDGAITRI